MKKKMLKLFKILLLLMFLKLMVTRLYQLHLINTIIDNDYILEIDHSLYGFYPSDYETINNGETTLIYFQRP